MRFDDLDKKLMRLGASMGEKVTVNPLKSLEPKKKVKRIRKGVLIPAVVVLLLMSTVAFAASPAIQSFFKNGINGLFIAEEQGKIQKNLGSATDKGITIDILAAIAGQDNIILQLGVTGIEQNQVSRDHYPRLVDFTNHLKLTDFNGKNYTFSEVQNVPMFRWEGDLWIENIKFDCALIEKTKMRVVIDQVLYTKGNWDIKFDLNYQKPITYYINKQFYSGNDYVYIDKVTIDAIETFIEVRMSESLHENHQVTFSSSKSYVDRSGSSRETIGIHEITSTVDGKSKAYLFVMDNPVPSDTTITVSIRGIGSEDKSFDFKLSEEHLIQ